MPFWQRGPNTPILRRPPYIAYPPFFKFCPTPHLPCRLHLHYSFYCLVFWLNGWSHHIWCVILINDIMDLHTSSLDTFVPEGLWSVLYATRRQAYWGLTHVVLCWYSDLISHTHKNTNTKKRHRAHSEASRLHTEV